MAKEFKAWDKAFTTIQLRKCYQEWDMYATAIGQDIGVACVRTHWPMRVMKWTHAEVRKCVYEQFNATEWQMFRVALKGKTTEQKLRILHARYMKNVSNVSISGKMLEDTKERAEQCRIDNYLGALVRGGQLSTDLVVQR